MANTKLSLILNYYGDEIYLYVNKTEIWKFKTHDKIPWYEFCSGSTSKDFTNNDLKEISLNDTIYDFSVDNSAIEKEDILNKIKMMVKIFNIYIITVKSYTILMWHRYEITKAF